MVDLIGLDFEFNLKPVDNAVLPWQRTQQNTAYIQTYKKKERLTPSDKRNSITAKATGLIFSLLDITSA